MLPLHLQVGYVWLFGSADSAATKAHLHHQLTVMVQWDSSPPHVFHSPLQAGYLSHGFFFFLCQCRGCKRTKYTFKGFKGFKDLKRQYYSHTSAINGNHITLSPIEEQKKILLIIKQNVAIMTM